MLYGFVCSVDIPEKVDSDMPKCFTQTKDTFKTSEILSNFKCEVTLLI